MHNHKDIWGRGCYALSYDKSSPHLKAKNICVQFLQFGQKSWMTILGVSAVRGGVPIPEKEVGHIFSANSIPPNFQSWMAEFAFPFHYRQIADMSVVESQWQREEVFKMGSLACSGCSQLVFFNKKQFESVKV